RGGVQVRQQDRVVGDGRVVERRPGVEVGEVDRRGDVRGVEGGGGVEVGEVQRISGRTRRPDTDGGGDPLRRRRPGERTGILRGGRDRPPSRPHVVVRRARQQVREVRRC